MSGIEIFGGVSAGIQLVESIQKLRAFCSTVKNAPSTLQDLIFDLETMALCLDQIERTQTTGDPLLLIRCLDRCRVSTSRIQVVVDKIQSIGAKRAFVSKLYTAMKDPDISKLFVELEQAKSTLSLTLIAFNSRNQTTLQNTQLARMEHQSVQLDLIWTQMRLNNEAIAQMSLRAVPPRSILHGYKRVPESSLELCAPGVCQKGTVWSKKARNRRFTIRLPQWLSSRVWRVCLTQAQSGWDLNLRTSTPRDPLSEVFFRCVKGDVKAVQKMTAEGEASLFDYSADVVRGNIRSSTQLSSDRPLRQEFSFLLVSRFDARVVHELTTRKTAIYHGQEELFEWLFRELGYRGIDFNHLAFVGGRYGTKTFDSILATILDKSSEIMDLDFTLPGNCKFIWHLTESQLETVLDNTDLLQSGITALEMFEHISNRRGALNRGMSFITAGMFLRLTGLASSSPQVATLVDSVDGFSILHLVAGMVANSFSGSLDYDLVRDWMSIARSALAQGMPPSIVALTNGEDKTPLLYLVFELYNQVAFETATPDEASTLVRLWLQTVQEAGIDLGKYGTAESELWRSSQQFHLEHIDSPDQWSILVSTQTTEVSLFRAWRMPGSFPSSPYMPEYISWYPEDCDRDGYYWQGIKPLTISRTWRDVFARDSDAESIDYRSGHPDDGFWEPQPKTLYTTPKVC
ncbi:hypothetical protein PRZ48_013231 [Zasmidium cellare]|uniref:NACHT-NTPase and P-loop NTPases N-terminal domain-containing protein n=1 Tax=Zasmidium cellare TaxID=395010 RepID=A0ABR0E3F9_ZASCE|nr:hypothetical protein PRZ48_013231 [Zasmidium cellare]